MDIPLRQDAFDVGACLLNVPDGGFFYHVHLTNRHLELVSRHNEQSVRSLTIDLVNNTLLDQEPGITALTFGAWQYFHIRI